MKYVEVVLPLPLDGLFTYAVADNQAAKAQVGCRVLVPLGKSKKYIGIVMHVVDEKPEFEVKPIIEVIDRVFLSKSLQNHFFIPKFAME